ncbi:hypothetical protein PENSPDRAFT_750172 [Peniophora sp. CONT]|nr:hypothetical protein PENSPDRAFT_750172 [Peniophora sp. CONT]
MAELPPPAPRIGGREQLPNLDLLPPVGSVLPQRQRQQEPRGRYDFTPPQVPAAILEDEPLIHQGVLHHQGVFNINIQPVQQAQPQGSPEDEVVPLADVDENLVGEDAPGGNQEHHNQDAGGDVLDENPEALGAPGLPIAPFVQHGIEANGAPEAVDVDPVQQPAAPVNGLDEDSDLPIAESPLVHSRSLPDHIKAEMSELAATLSPDNAAGEVDLYILLQRGWFDKAQS